jgi:hypothetical protein
MRYPELMNSFGPCLNVKLCTESTLFKFDRIISKIGLASLKASNVEVAAVWQFGGFYTNPVWC